MKRKKNGFTLIELLAVIVILAIIALIATPIILGIVEDARKDSFERSVELVISTTDLDVSNKNIQEGYKYEIVDGNVSNLEVGIKNTNGMNGEIYYDETGNSVYAIHNGVYCVRKTSGMEKAEISDYVEGECMAKKMFLSTIQNLVPTGEVTSGTGVISNLGTYGIRYQGADPNNYVYFNCSDYSNQSDETCEIWRIIGIVDGKVKIIKNESIGQMEFDHKYDDNGAAWNANWNEAQLQLYLNGEYYESFNNNTKKMISTSTWYLRANNVSSATSRDELFNLERTTGPIMFEIESVDKNIGLLYPSDYAYAAIENDQCFATAVYLSCMSTNWLSADQWTITPSRHDTSRDYYAIFIQNGGMGYGSYNVDVAWPRDVYPTLYLDPNVSFVEGDGSINNKYQLSY